MLKQLTLDFGRFDSEPNKKPARECTSDGPILKVARYTTAPNVPTFDEYVNEIELRNLIRCVNFGG